MFVSTLMALVGEWRGDASTRRYSRQASVGERARGFGKGRPPSPPKSDVNVFKLRLTYSWDGRQTVLRQLDGSSFNGEALDAIRRKIIPFTVCPYVPWQPLLAHTLASMLLKLQTSKLLARSQLLQHVGQPPPIWRYCKPSICATACLT